MRGNVTKTTARERTSLQQSVLEGAYYLHSNTVRGHHDQRSLLHLTVPFINPSIRLNYVANC